MNLLFKIIEVHPQQHSIVVRFFTDKITEDMLATQRDVDGTILRCRTDYNIDLPIPSPTGDALDELIASKAPRSWLETMEAVQDPSVDTSLSDIASLVGVVKSA
jgi:hypothetical protein